MTFWFGPTFDRGLNTKLGPEQMKRWFGSGSDEEIISKFKGDHEKFVSGQYDHWTHDKDGRLACILL